MKYFWTLILVISGLIASQTVITISNTEYSDDFFFEKYSKEEWEKATDSHKTRMVNDFIRRKVFAEEALSLNLQMDPSVRIDIYNQKNRLLVNHSYEEFVAKPLITDELIRQTKENIKKELMVHHILVGYSGSRLQKKIERSDDEALELAQQIYELHSKGESFEDLAVKYSDDRSVTSNQGKLGWLYWGQTVQEFQATAFSAGVNSLSAPVKTEYGYHLILVSEDRASEQYSDIDPGSDNYNDFIQQTARTCVSSKLQPAAQEYDIQTIKEYGVVFDTEQLRNIYSEIEKTLKKNKITGNPNVDIVSVLNNMENISTVCVINNKGFGVKWFASKFGRLPMSRRPRINSLESLESVFTITILQEVAIERASLSKLDQDPLFESMFDGYETSILFEAFKKYVDNSLVEADSAMIADYYHENKDIEFSEGEKVSLREIRVSTQSLSDSLYSFINNEDDFIEIARQFSLINPEDGGKKQPFARGKFATLGDKAFTLDVGEISRPFENLDRSWSIIMLIEKIPNGYKPLEKVKNKIVTILNRENKASKKDELFEELKIKYGVVIEDGFFQFESSEEPDPAG
ncbi:MAG: hypothetical protein HN729_08740 [Candidatus Marinimicrobia bacterium]|nr:hypothetical protein [Candidatus Neomarinimicrobiota bacterium]MBT3683648.1 hypothetical protein [Candidatus Neomarinimicrobiota bacterium]MBT3760427.1 hypothetical protein [Candidatus Neomarinimicrobiota bacterium]MBT3896495.1 hypothetical protein [Candidatus Neomarinimicrobiota bacterium]MBT4173591.1 hypothetical protein [Candidatus Neomarinimicrobiota bacterium]